MLQLSIPLSYQSEIWVLVSILVYIALLVTSAIGLSSLVLFHARLLYVGMTTVGYFDSRRAKGPELWRINTRTHRLRMKEAKKHISGILNI